MDAEIPAPADWTGSASMPMGADEVFNGYVAANVIFALDQAGLFDRLADGAVDIDKFAADTGGNPAALSAVVRAATALGYLRYAHPECELTKTGHGIRGMRGYFTWGIGGYREVFAQAGRMASGEGAYGVDVGRDEAMVGLGAGQNDTAFMVAPVARALADVEFASIADLGSGVCDRLCRMVTHGGGVRGVGVDLSAPATSLARDRIAAAGLSGQVEAVQADVLELLFKAREPDPALRDVDAVMSFFLLHDLLADPGKRSEILPRMREAFPGARTFILADTMVRPDEGTGRMPIFSVGYELAHALMGVPLHPREEYERLFAEAGLHTRRAVPFGTPHSWLYVLDAR